MKRIIELLKKHKIFIILVSILLLLIFLNLFLNPEADELPEPKPSPFERQKEYTPPSPEMSLKPEVSDSITYSPTPIPTEAVEPIISPSPLGDDFSESEQDIKLIEETQQLYPLIDYLPIDNELYYLAYSAPYELVVLLRSGDKNAVENEITDWIESKGVDPETHTIIFK
jgi:hypothetical protein